MCKITPGLVACVLWIAFSFSISSATEISALKNYSADVETTTPHGTTKTRIFFKDGKRRVEEHQDLSHGYTLESITIMRPDKKVMWILVPGKKRYVEVSLDAQKQKTQNAIQDLDSLKTEKKFMGDEIVEGHPSKKYHLTIMAEDKKEKSGYIWEATDLNNFPVKYQDEEKKNTSIWKNIKSDDVPDSVFEIPEGYKKVEMQMPGTGDVKAPEK
jgi:hypothetical protein